MQFFIAFLEGIITFVSPCLLPMLPIYVSYFACGGERGSRVTLKNALGFVLGFSAVFVALGALAGAIGGFLVRYRSVLDVVTGLIVVAFGLGCTGLFRLPFFGLSASARTSDLGFFSSAVLGIVFSVGWTPCVGAFLGSALALASTQGSVAKGVLMLVCYCAGLGIPFVISALLIDRLRGAFELIKRNYTKINIACGIFLIAVGVMMATGLMSRIVGLLA